MNVMAVPTVAVDPPTRSLSRSQSTATLPDTPLLAPIHPVAVPRQPTNESIVTASSVTSHDTFMTALTSTPSPSSPTAGRLNNNLASPHTLRKSISVDSFIKNRRSPDLSEPGPSSGVHSRGYSRDSFDSDSGLDPDLEEWNARPSHPEATGGHYHPRASKTLTSRVLGRSRGHSLSGPSASEYDDPYLDDSEHERTADMAHLSLLPTHRSHSAASPLTNGYGKGKAKARPGDVLLLPPRAPTLSNASSVSSLGSTANGTTFTEGVPPVPPLPHSHTRRNNIPGPLVMPRRTRSGSLSTNSNRNSWGSNGNEVSIAIVGPPGCGKTTVIKKGLKGWGLTDESLCSVATPKGRLRYSTRTATIQLGNQMTKVTHVLELDSDTLNLDTPNGAWPEGLPHIDGVLVCYDASNRASFTRYPNLLACYHALHLSAVAIACKCDLEKKVPPHWASERAQPYSVGLVEVTSATDAGKKKMRSCFGWLLRAINQAKRGDLPPGSPYRNPASPDVLTAPWTEGFPETRTVPKRSSVSTPSAGSPSTRAPFREHPLATSVHVPSSPPGGASTPTPRSPSAPTSPTRVKSMSDLLSEVEQSRHDGREKESHDGHASVIVSLGRVASQSVGSLHETQETLVEDRPRENESESLEKGSGERKEGSFGKDNDPPPMPWATLEELLEKLFFLAVSGDDQAFIDHFFLTYRKFATPRIVLLGMQKRIRQLSTEHADLLLGSYAQMRICDLLEQWTEEYPNDFAAPKAEGALTALVKQIASKQNTAHYGSDLFPFIDELPNLHDMEVSWAVKGEEESDDDGAGALEEEEEVTSHKNDAPKPSAAVPLPVAEQDPAEIQHKPPIIATRERKGSTSTKSLLSTPLTTTLSGSSESSRSASGRISGARASLKDLVKVSQTLAAYDAQEVAEEITRRQSQLFLAIEPREWLRYTMGVGRADPEREPISLSATFYNRLSMWVTSLILAHDRVKSRARQVERFADIAIRLRHMNNYAGLRAVMTGISNATYPNDEIMALHKSTKATQHKMFKSYEILLNSTRNHRAYRMALKHTDGAGIPDMEVHTFDMVRANESNPNYKADDPTKIHWGKFTLMARMITMLHKFQMKIRSTREYEFDERPYIAELLEVLPMDEDMQRSRVIPPPDDAYQPPHLGFLSQDSPNSTRLDATRFKRLFFW